MKRWLALALALWLLCGSAAAESDTAERILSGLDLRPLEEFAAATELDANPREIIRGLLAGDAALRPGDLLEALLVRTRGIWRELRACLPAMLLPALVAAIAAARTKGGRTAQAARLLCCLACAVTEIRLLASLFAEVRGLSEQILAFQDAVLPVFTALLTAAGATASAAYLPQAAIAGRAGAELLSGKGVSLCAAAAVLAVAGSLNPRFHLSKLLSLCNSLVNWGTGLLLTGYLGLLGAQGLLGAGWDSASVRTARYAVDNLLPVIGGEVADSLDGVLSSLVLVKNALGVTGLLLLVRACAGPFLRIALALALLRLTAAVIEPLDEGCVSGLTDACAQVAQMLLLLASACIVLAVLLLGAMLIAGQNLAR